MAARTGVNHPFHLKFFPIHDRAHHKFTLARARLEPTAVGSRQKWNGREAIG
jgi:hypothetical protein